MIACKINERILTDFPGYRSLLNIYHEYSQFQDACVRLDFEDVRFFEANLCGLLLGILHKLKVENGLEFDIDETQLPEELNVLIRNHFVNQLTGSNHRIKDVRKSTIPARSFATDDVSGFVDYIEHAFLGQRGLKDMPKHAKARIQNNYLEIFSNVDLHANTDYPVFVCGQYFPKNGTVKFSMTDLGEGFLPRIQDFTNGKINNSHHAILWALRGNSTKPDAKGGSGLSNTFKYCVNNQGDMHVITGDCYWKYENGEVQAKRIKTPFCGVTIHLIFQHEV